MRYLFYFFGRHKKNQRGNANLRIGKKHVRIGLRRIKESFHISTFWTKLDDNPKTKRLKIKPWRNIYTQSPDPVFNQTREWIKELNNRLPWTHYLPPLILMLLLFILALLKQRTLFYFCVCVCFFFQVLSLCGW